MGSVHTWGGTAISVTMGCSTLNTHEGGLHSPFWKCRPSEAAATRWDLARMLSILVPPEDYAARNRILEKGSQPPWYPGSGWLTARATRELTTAGWWALEGVGGTHRGAAVMRRSCFMGLGCCFQVCGFVLLQSPGRIARAHLS